MRARSLLLVGMLALACVMLPVVMDDDHQVSAEYIADGQSLMPGVETTFDTAFDCYYQVTGDAIGALVKGTEDATSFTLAEGEYFNVYATDTGGTMVTVVNDASTFTASNGVRFYMQLASALDDMLGDASLAGSTLSVITADSALIQGSMVEFSAGSTLNHDADGTTLLTGAATLMRHAGDLTIVLVDTSVTVGGTGAANLVMDADAGSLSHTVTADVSVPVTVGTMQYTMMPTAAQACTMTVSNGIGNASAGTVLVPDGSVFGIGLYRIDYTGTNGATVLATVTGADVSYTEGTFGITMEDSHQWTYHTSGSTAMTFYNGSYVHLTMTDGETLTDATGAITSRACELQMTGGVAMMTTGACDVGQGMYVALTQFVDTHRGVTNNGTGQVNVSIQNSTYYVTVPAGGSAILPYGDTVTSDIGLSVECYEEAATAERTFIQTTFLEAGDNVTITSSYLSKTMGIASIGEEQVTLTDTLYAGQTSIDVTAASFLAYTVPGTVVSVDTGTFEAIEYPTLHYSGDNVVLDGSGGVSMTASSAIDVMFESAVYGTVTNGTVDGAQVTLDPDYMTVTMSVPGGGSMTGPHGNTFGSSTLGATVTLTADVVNRTSVQYTLVGQPTDEVSVSNPLFGDIALVTGAADDTISLAETLDANDGSITAAGMTLGITAGGSASTALATLEVTADASLSYTADTLRLLSGAADAIAGSLFYVDVSTDVPAPVTILDGGPVSVTIGAPTQFSIPAGSSMTTPFGDTFGSTGATTVLTLANDAADATLFTQTATGTGGSMHVEDAYLDVAFDITVSQSATVTIQVTADAQSDLAVSASTFTIMASAGSSLSGDAGTYGILAESTFTIASTVPDLDTGSVEVPAGTSIGTPAGTIVTATEAIVTASATQVTLNIPDGVHNTTIGDGELVVDGTGATYGTATYVRSTYEAELYDLTGTSVKYYGSVGHTYRLMVQGAMYQEVACDTDGFVVFENLTAQGYDLEVDAVTATIDTVTLLVQLRLGTLDALTDTVLIQLKEQYDAAIAEVPSITTMADLEPTVGLYDDLDAMLTEKGITVHSVDESLAVIDGQYVTIWNQGYATLSSRDVAYYEALYSDDQAAFDADFMLMNDAMTDYGLMTEGARTILSDSRTNVMDLKHSTAIMVLEGCGFIGDDEQGLQQAIQDISASEDPSAIDDMTAAYLHTRFMANHPAAGKPFQDVTAEDSPTLDAAWTAMEGATVTEERLLDTKETVYIDVDGVRHFAASVYDRMCKAQFLTDMEHTDLFLTDMLRHDEVGTPLEDFADVLVSTLGTMSYVQGTEDTIDVIGTYSATLSADLEELRDRLTAYRDLLQQVNTIESRTDSLVSSGNYDAEGMAALEELRDEVLSTLDVDVTDLTSLAIMEMVDTAGTLFQEGVSSVPVVKLDADIEHGDSEDYPEGDEPIEGTLSGDDIGYDVTMTIDSKPVSDTDRGQLDDLIQSGTIVDGLTGAPVDASRLQGTSILMSLDINVMRGDAPVTEGDFDITFQIPGRYAGCSGLAVIFIDTVDGTIEVYEVDVDDRTASFSTNHMSVYHLVGVEVVEDPVVNMAVLVVGLIVIAIASYLLLCHLQNRTDRR